jgi:dTMP kinase
MRQGKGRSSGWTCSTDRHGSSDGVRLLLPYGWTPVFVTFEGADGSGKSTQAELLRAALAAEGHEVVLTREPGGTEFGELVRTLVLDGPDMAPWAEAALFAASRSQHVEEVIRPALERGADVVCDRYFDSSLAYQGIARGLGVDAVLELNLAVTGGLVPDVTFLLLLDPGVATGRHVDPDRLEREGTELQAKVDAAYRELARRFPERIVTIDATGSPDEIAREVRERLRERS